MAAKAKRGDAIVHSRADSLDVTAPARRTARPGREISDEQFGLLDSRIDAMERDLDRLLTDLKWVHT